MARVAGLNGRSVGALLLCAAVVACSAREPSSIDSVASTTAVTDPAVASSQVPGRPPTTVLFVGDSLAVEAGPYLEAVLTEVEVQQANFGGTAPCDWLLADLAFAASTLVVVSFNGNSSTPCTRGGSLIERYRADLDELVRRARAEGSDVLLVQQPVRESDPDGNVVIAAINEHLSRIAARGDARVVDAGAAVENPDGSYARRLPCEIDESDCAADGTVQVRHADGVHFCPESTRFIGRCDRYSPGAWRFAQAIADAL